MAINPKTHTVIQVYVPRTEAKKIRQYARRQKSSVSMLLRRLVNAVVSAAEASSQA